MRTQGNWYELLRRVARNPTAWAGGAVVAVAALAVAGPRVAVEEPRNRVELPDDLDAYLLASESRFAGLTPGTEKVIRWADASERAVTPWSVVYLHGFSASRQETAPLADSVAAHLGANLFYTRLTGHGLPGEALAIGRRLGERVLVVGTSTGGTLASWLATDPDWAASIGAMVLISPNFGPRDPRSDMLLWPWGRQLARAVIGEWRSWDPVNERQEEFWLSLIHI